MTKLKKNVFEATKKAVFEYKLMERKAETDYEQAAYWEMILERKREKFNALYEVIIESGLEDEYAEWRYGKGC